MLTFTHGDIFKSGASNSKSRVDGGDGMDTLQLTS